MSQTAQVLPAATGNAACPQIIASNLTPYIYNGALHSFEFTVPDASYVAVAGSIGGTGIPFNLMTRWSAPGGALKVHVDVATTPIYGTLPLTVTLLSSQGAGHPVCVTTVSIGVGAGPIQRSPTTSPSAPATLPVSSTYTPPKTTGTPDTSSSQPSQASNTPSSSTAAATSGMSTSAGAVMSSISSALQSACATPIAAQRTWLVLLLLYMLVVGLALWAEFPMSLPAMRTPERVAAIILVLLLALLGFWYFSASCRAALWMPLVAALIAVLGLLAAYRNHPRVAQLLLIQNESSS